jgi:predicted site-specific integrase-resolvase
MIKIESDEKIDEKESIIKTLNKNIFKKKIFYCRVSSYSQKIELNNQIK